ncbi:phenylalanyl-tRNA synthetase [Coprinopsis cinerea okayama7|uniref:Phenylalanine--tRNA ligase, mitochondrial n=1 Tax=Coprinopsis cinerea (strain Okayama-7 / 130 / ATCC MYA-4618 / FGSC 9003) TaxID=240176 RepID=A8NFE3_COPC7|nr:phenylalanyl-tRNA synthetase [Coprinopsis cinerea okayama7\|eukprot:XP_001833262.1 phenylalanyl-tRNA synthetase [Coprinopsis cinerea okayama7\
MLSRRLVSASSLRHRPHWQCRYTSSLRHVTIGNKQYPADDWTNITPSIISKIPLQLHNKPGHPLATLRSLIENHFTGFSHVSSFSPVVSPFKNFDELSFPADHPGRAVTDSYYINRDLMLRTHTSAHEVEMFRKGEDKWLLTADVYRRDEIDASHYPVFHQVEGARIFDATPTGLKEVQEDNARLAAQLSQTNIIIEDIPHVSPTNPVQPMHDPKFSEEVALNLKLSLNGMIYKLFGGATKEPLRVRWIEAYFPFTSPSFEVEVFYQGKWLEILGSGVVVQATLDTAGVNNKIGWAFGLGLERIAMVLFSIPDIRLFWSADERFHSQFQAGKITTFKPYSKYPACYKDVSFWLPKESAFHENDFCDLVRDMAGDLVEDVKKIDEFVHPKTNRTSLCYRVNYRSMDRSLSNQEINAIQAKVTSQLKDQFEVEIR